MSELLGYKAIIIENNLFVKKNKVEFRIPYRKVNSVSEFIKELDCCIKNKWLDHFIIEGCRVFDDNARNNISFAEYIGNDEFLQRKKKELFEFVDKYTLIYTLFAKDFINRNIGTMHYPELINSSKIILEKPQINEKCFVFGDLKIEILDSDKVPELLNLIKNGDIREFLYHESIFIRY